MEKINEPTEERIAAFWEWCGFQRHFGGGWFYERYKSTNAWWESPDGRKYKDLPPIDLNFLFKYAMPILQDKGSQVEILGFEHKGYRATVYEDGFSQDGAGSFEPFIQPKSQVDNNAPALALFWAIYEVMHYED